MRTTSLKSIYLSRKELKVAISDFLTHRSGRSDLAFHLDENECYVAWNSVGEEFAISINGEIKDERKSSLYESFPSSQHEPPEE
jgi:hypothetical protein